MDLLEEHQELKSWLGHIEFDYGTEQMKVLLQLPHQTILIVSGNQAGKTSNVAEHYFLRTQGRHPIENKNRLAKKIRCMSSSLPISADAEEQDNTQYLELKKRIPRELIIKDITARSQNLVIHSPIHGKSIFEFRSSKQELQDLGKIQLSSVWHDEETPKGHREECRVRLLAEDGDEIFSLTATNPFSYVYDDIFERAAFLFRTKTIANKFGIPQVEHRNTGADIACIQMATDDNPTLDIGAIERILHDVTDPDEYILRRYGVFKQISGRVHKTYDPAICYIDMNKYFPNGIPDEWFHARGIDYHESRIPWSIGWLSVSPYDEWFLWQEFHPAIDGPKAYNTYEIAKAIFRKSGDYEYGCNLIDPLAKKKQPNTLFSCVDDLNRYFDEIRRTGGARYTVHRNDASRFRDNVNMKPACFWEAWDTKDTTGRAEVAKRFKNAVRCGVPFNNTIHKKGIIKQLPTLWILNTCPNFHRSIMRWNYGEWVTSQSKAVNDPKPTPQQKWSHDNMVLECLAKDHRLLYAAHFMSHTQANINQHRKTSVTGR